jgi:methyl coenzyme M reductase subunit D
VRLHGGEAIQHPQHAVEQRGVVWRRRVLLHRPIIPDAVERGPARERARHVHRSKLVK